MIEDQYVTLAHGNDGRFMRELAIWRTVTGGEDAAIHIHRPCV